MIKELTVIGTFILPLGNCNDVPCGACSIMYDTIFGPKLPSCLRLSKSEAYLGMVVL